MLSDEQSVKRKKKGEYGGLIEIAQTFKSVN